MNCVVCLFDPKRGKGDKIHAGSVIIFGMSLCLVHAHLAVNAAHDTENVTFSELMDEV